MPSSPSIPVSAQPKGLSGFAPQAAVQDRLSELSRGARQSRQAARRCYVRVARKRRGARRVRTAARRTRPCTTMGSAGRPGRPPRLGLALSGAAEENNTGLCFNWFEPGDTRRGQERRLIAAMARRMVGAHGIDPARIFVTGMSAGGAMASAMLATIRRVLGGRDSSRAWLMAARTGSARRATAWAAAAHDAAALAQAGRRASPHDGHAARPGLGRGATIIRSCRNADAIALQWTGLHGLGAEPDRIDAIDGHSRSIWLGKGGEPLIEHYRIAGMAHGVPLDGGGEDALGQPGPHMLEVGLSSTQRIAEFFGIAAGKRARRAAAASSERAPKPASSASRPAAKARPAPTGPQAVIEKALRAAGLMR